MKCFIQSMKPIRPSIIYSNNLIRRDFKSVKVLVKKFFNKKKNSIYRVCLKFLTSMVNGKSQPFSITIIYQSIKCIIRFLMNLSNWRSMSEWQNGLLKYSINKSVFVPTNVFMGIQDNMPLQRFICPWHTNNQKNGTRPAFSIGQNKSVRVHSLWLSDY